MANWLKELPFDPLPPLLRSGSEAVELFTRKYLLDEAVSFELLHELPEPKRLFRRQQPDGSWLYPGGSKKIRSAENYNQIETYRNLGILIEQYGQDNKHPAIRNAAEWLFTFQANEGDLRGIYGNQYSPNYTAGIAELLIKAGYEDDPRIARIFKWLLEIRQDDGGWAIPLRTLDYNLDVISSNEPPVMPDRERPFSYMVTGVVLRAFAAHKNYRRSKEAKQAGELLISRFFKKDSYPDRAAPDFWLRFSFPFWFTDLISSLDSISLLSFPKNEPRIKSALQWFVDNQDATGLWDLKVLKGHNRDVLRLWLVFSICRTFKRFYN